MKNVILLAVCAAIFGYHFFIKDRYVPSFGPSPAAAVATVHPALVSIPLFNFSPV